MNESVDAAPRPTVDVLSEPTEDQVAQIIDLEKATFNWETSDADMNDLADTVKDPESVVGVIRNANNEIVGYIVAIPATSADESIKENDPDYAPTEEDLYIETFAIAPNYRLLNTADLIKAMAGEAVRRGYTKIVGHVPEARLYTAFGAQEIRTIDDWYDSGKSHVYIEYQLPSVT